VEDTEEFTKIIAEEIMRIDGLKEEDKMKLLGELENQEMEYGTKKSSKSVDEMRSDEEDEEELHDLISKTDPKSIDAINKEIGGTDEMMKEEKIEVKDDSEPEDIIDEDYNRSDNMIEFVFYYGINKVPAQMSIYEMLRISS
jgi:hypothetical protein